MDRDSRILSHTKGFAPTVVRRKPAPNEGSNGDIALGHTSSGIKLFAKIGSRWYSFSADEDITLETYEVSNLTIDRTYNANSTTTAELADIIGTLINDLKKFGLLKSINT